MDFRTDSPDEIDSLQEYTSNNPYDNSGEDHASNNAKEKDDTVGWELEQEIKDVNGNDRIIIVFQVSNGDIGVGGGEKDFSIKVYDQHFNKKHTLKVHKGEINMIVQEMHYIISTADDAKIVGFDIEKDYEITKILDHHYSNEVGLIATFPKQRLVSGGSKGNLKFWDILSWRCLKYSKYKNAQIDNLLYLQKTENLAVLLRYNKVVFFDVSGEEIKVQRTLNVLLSIFRRILRFTDDLVIIICSNGQGDIYDTQSMTSVGKIKSSFDTIVDAWMMDKETLIIYDDIGRVEVFRLRKPLKGIVLGEDTTLKLDAQLYGYPHSGFCALKDGRFISGTYKGSLKIYKKLSLSP